jgi:diphosphomevalonate decarboxylase
LAEVRCEGQGHDRWVAELPRARFPQGRGVRAPEVPRLSDSGVARVLRHVERVRAALPSLLAPYGLRTRAGACELRAANTFPAASGIASSASSFAAITLATVAALSADPRAFARAYEGETELKRALARLSRQGSGSSCRSFEGPWVLWERESAAALQTQLPAMTDFVLIVAGQAKSVSSSEAHRRVKTSPLWSHRTDRAGDRVRTLEASLGEGNVAEIARVAWAEFWEMHSLFHTCAESFTYWEPGTLEALKWLEPHVRQPDPPIVTMDAGPNIHILVPTAKADAWRTLLTTAFKGEILEDRSGQGATLLEVTD